MSRHDSGFAGLQPDGERNPAMCTRSILTFLLLAACTLLALKPALADRDIRTEQVHFKRGANSTVIEASIKGYEIVDYVLRASKGQYMNASMATDNGASYFNILAPGEDEVAMFIGSTSGNQYEGTLPASGDYKIRIYMMRSAARRNEVANYRLEIIIDGTPAPSAEVPRDAAASDATTRAAEGDYDATGQIPCAQFAGQPMGQCDFGVSRASGGTATVVITRPDGSTRALFFIEGKFNSADTSQADGYPEYSAERESDLNLITVGKERYEIPDAVIWGG
jgi:hypothetical protein